MGALIDLFKGIGDIIVTLVDFLYGTIRDLVYVISLLGTLVAKIPMMIGWLPTVCISTTVTIFSIVVIYKILGREG